MACGRRQEAAAKQGKRGNVGFLVGTTPKGASPRGEGDMPPSASPIDTRPKSALATDPNALRSALRRHRANSFHKLSGDVCCDRTLKVAEATDGRQAAACPTERPGASGLHLHRLALRARPGVASISCSGYHDNEIQRCWPGVSSCTSFAHSASNGPHLLIRHVSSIWYS